MEVRLCQKFYMVLDWIRGDNQDFQSALHENPDTAREWMQTLRGLTDQLTDKPVSHSLAKQVYWLAGEDPRSDSEYHLLQPMFPSSLAHAVHADIQDVRFGEINTEVPWRCLLHLAPS